MMRNKNVLKGLTAASLLTLSFSAFALDCQDIKHTEWQMENGEGHIGVAINGGDHNDMEVTYTYSYTAGQKSFHLYFDNLNTQCHANKDGSVTLDMVSSKVKLPWKTNDLHITFNSIDKADFSLDLTRHGKVIPISVRGTLHRV
jgi:hypothetical protein